MNTRLLLIPAVGASALLFWFGTGLEPVWWCAWLAPLPVLALATRVSPLFAFVSCTLAWLIGSLNE